MLAESPLLTVLVYVSLGLVVLWTVRLARVKRRNPLVWGGIALVLIVVAETMVPDVPSIIGMAPMVALLFLKPVPTAAPEPAPEAVTCPKCHAYHAAGHSYCVNCGWELRRPYVDDPQAGGETRRSTVVESPPREATSAAGAPPPEVSPMEQQSRVEETFPGIADSGPVEEAESQGSEVIGQPAGAEFSSDAEHPAETGLASDGTERALEGAAADSASTGRDPATEPAAEVGEPATESVPNWAPPEPAAGGDVSSPSVTAVPVEMEEPAGEQRSGFDSVPTFRQPLTPALFTGRGAEYRGEGRFQEAVDQFTKAIALDGQYRAALEGRREAYLQLGLDAKAAEDQELLNSLAEDPQA